MPGDTDIIKRPWMRELREWATFGASFLIYPVIWLIFNNVKLELNSAKFELKQEIQKEFVTRETYSQDKDRTAADRVQELQTIGLIQGKLEAIQLEQIHESDSLALIKETVSNRKSP